MTCIVPNLMCKTMCKTLMCKTLMCKTMCRLPAKPCVIPLQYLRKSFFLTAKHLVFAQFSTKEFTELSTSMNRLYVFIIKGDSKLLMLSTSHTTTTFNNNNKYLIRRGVVAQCRCV